MIISGRHLTGDILANIIRNTAALQMVIKRAVNEKFNKGEAGITGGNELIVWMYLWNTLKEFSIAT